MSALVVSHVVYKTQGCTVMTWVMLALLCLFLWQCYKAVEYAFNCTSLSYVALELGKFREHSKSWLHHINSYASFVSSKLSANSMTWWCTLKHEPIRSCPHSAKQWFHSEKASNVFLPHYTGETWKQNNHRSVWICGWWKLSQGYHTIVLRLSVL